MGNEVILCKYGELILKGANRGSFEQKLLKEIRRRAAHVGNFSVESRQSTILIRPKDDSSAGEPLSRMEEEALKVFGISAVSRSVVCGKNMDEILHHVARDLPERLRSFRTFRADAKRADKSFPLTSPEIAEQVGASLLENAPWLHVDLSHPDVTVRVEIRDDEAFIHADQKRGAGGMPQGSSGRGLLLLSGGIDSPVAGFMMAKRGMTVEALHFESFPYTSILAREKVFRLAEKLTDYTGRMPVHVISLTRIQEEIRDRCNEDYFTLILRRFMMELADTLAKKTGAGAIVTGESLGQVASQTLDALKVTDEKASIPVFRPCIGMDKEEIVSVSRKIGTFDISVEPYEDCCTVFTPKHPKIMPKKESVLKEEEKLDRASLLAEAEASLYTVVARQYGDLIEIKNGEEIPYERF